MGWKDRTGLTCKVEGGEGGGAWFVVQRAGVCDSRLNSLLKRPGQGKTHERG